MAFVVNNLEYFTFNFSEHSINTRKKLQLQGQITNLTSSKKSVYYASIKFYNKLLECITGLIKDKTHFISALNQPKGVKPQMRGRKLSVRV
jgi:Mg2+ and Co2+ transporter CorA